MGFKVITATGGIKSGSSVSSLSLGGLIGVQVITATGSGTYTPTAGTASIVIELVGGGAGGGGATSSSAGNCSLAQGGTGAGYLRKRLTAAFSGASYSVGAKGAGGAAGNNNGNDGSDTTFTATGGGGTVYTAKGGNKGLGAAANGQGTPVTHRASASVGGIATNGDINVPGGVSGCAFGLSTSQGYGAQGGDSFLGKGGLPGNITAVNSSVAGGNGTGYGAAGAGGIVHGTGGSVAGGDGTDGVLIIWEYGS